MTLNSANSMVVDVVGNEEPIWDQVGELGNRRELGKRGRAAKKNEK
jgi:hypothetical protein